MKRRQLLVNTLLVLALTGLGWFCWQGGKSYTILLENLPYTAEDGQQPGLEAIYAYIDNGKQVFMLEGDRTAVTGMGKSHTLKIETLDENDLVLETREIVFTMEDLGEPASLNVARAFREGRV